MSYFDEIVIILPMPFRLSVGNDFFMWQKGQRL